MASVDRHKSETSDSGIFVDVSAIGRSLTRDWITSSIEAISGSDVIPKDFWSAFFDHPKSLPKHMIVVADFAEIARLYLKHSEYGWAASVRNSLPVLVGLLRTKRDTESAGLVDVVLKHSDSRLRMSSSMQPSKVLACLSEAIGNCDPRSIIEVRYQSFRDCLWVEFSDGFSGFVGFDQLGMAELRDDLVAETALVGEHGYSVQMLKKSGLILDLDSDSIRATLDDAHAQRIAIKGINIISKLGEIIRYARTRARLTQTDLSARTGIDQALISKMERGKHRPRIDTLRKIAEGLGTNVSALLSPSE